MNVFFRQRHAHCMAPQAPIPTSLRPVSLVPDAFMGSYTAAQWEARGWELTFFRQFVAAVARGTRGAPAWLEEAHNMCLYAPVSNTQKSKTCPT